MLSPNLHGPRGGSTEPHVLQGSAGGGLATGAKREGPGSLIWWRCGGQGWAAGVGPGRTPAFLVAVDVSGAWQNLGPNRSSLDNGP